VDVFVDPKFRKLVPQLTADEREQLEQNLVRDGCRDPLVVWRNANRQANSSVFSTDMLERFPRLDAKIALKLPGGSVHPMARQPNEFPVSFKADRIPI
jgi:hypothetical protein